MLAAANGVQPFQRWTGVRSCYWNTDPLDR